MIGFAAWIRVGLKWLMIHTGRHTAGRAGSFRILFEGYLPWTTAPNRPTAEEISDLVVQRLVEGGGIPDLANANLMTIEEQTIKEVERVTQIVMSELISQQSQEADPVTACPKCGKQLTPKKAQHRSLQSRRGQVKFKTDVSHCEACRLDFFPSDENIAL